MIGLVMLFGCAVGPDYVKPSAPTPESYKEMKGWKEAQPREGVIRGKWWEMFNDAGLNALEETVNISNQNVAAAEAQFRQARALVQAARAAYFPTLSAGASYTRSRSSSNTVSGGSSSGIVSDYLLSFDASWEPDIWGKVRRSVESGEANAQASAADLESARLSAQAELAQDYFQLQDLDAQKQLLDTAASAYQRFLDLTMNRYASGVASRADILQAQTQLKTTQAQAIDIGVQRAQIEHAIALLVGKPASDFSIPVMQLAADLPPIPVGMPSELLERRPDVAAAERRMAAANAQIGVAQAAYYPAITLSASGGYQSAGSADWLTWPSRFWSVGPASMETVYDGGLRKAQTEQARAAYDANVASYRQTVLTGFQEVEDNLAALRILEEEAGVQDEAVTAAQQSVMVTTNQYKAGTASALDVIVTRITELNNKRTAISITGNRLTASVLLIKALGGGWSAEALQSSTDNHSHGPGNDDKLPIGIPEKGMMMETK
jgi:NodT family efflux transporter outer membrane factor (OMF) lipoprotein